MSHLKACHSISSFCLFIYLNIPVLNALLQKYFSIYQMLYTRTNTSDHIIKQISYLTDLYFGLKSTVVNQYQRRGLEKGLRYENGISDPRKQEEGYIFPQRSFLDNFNSQGFGVERFPQIPHQSIEDNIRKKEYISNVSILKTYYY